MLHHLSIPVSNVELSAKFYDAALGALGYVDATIDEFHRAALRHGGTDYGEPGLRPHYGPQYYAAFVLDPDGYRLEA